MEHGEGEVVYSVLVQSEAVLVVLVAVDQVYQVLADIVCELLLVSYSQNDNSLSKTAFVSSSVRGRMAAVYCCSRCNNNPGGSQRHDFRNLPGTSGGREKWKNN